ncbi:MAG TPA: hypothetical protein VEL74_08780 [Thermoanaerobaculia bacterium]|nr:hypothetical protein [Thermoanaerobaculia bacterium]
MGERSAVAETRTAAPRRLALGWWVLGLLLLATLAASIFFSPAARPPVGDEVTVAMAAASLAWDRDLTWAPADSERFAEQWGTRPDRLRLRPRDGGFTYDTPSLYALLAAPMVRVAPVRGTIILNALLLAAAALLTARALSLHLGGAAPVWVTVLLFASVAFAYVFRVQSDVFLLAATATGFALIYGGERSRRKDEPLPEMYEPEPNARGGAALVRWLAAGALLAVPATVHPLYLLLLVPALLAATRVNRVVVVLGAAALLAAVLWTQGDLPDVQETWGSEAPAFDMRSGTPREDRRSGSEEQREGMTLHPRLAGWNGLYFLAGRSTGVLPYFLPLLLGFAAYRGDRGRWAILLAVVAIAAGFLLLRPFDFIGGEGAIANRLFLPLYAALWFLAARPVRVLPALVVIILAVPFLYILWSHPAAVALAGEPRSYTSPVAERWLPYETTQRHAPGRALFQNALWLKLLDRDLWTPRGADSLRLLGGAELLAGSSLPVQVFVLELDANAPSRLEIGGQELRPVLLRPDGSLAFEVPAGEPRAVHPLWWSRGEDYYLYDLDFRLPGAPAGPIRFRVLPRRDSMQRSDG